MGIMRCRAMKDKNVIWFGSYGKDENGKAKFYNPENHKQSYSENQVGVTDSLTQRLSIIKSELWYYMSYGLPLYEKVKSKIYMDSHIASVINSHPDVIRIESFESKIENKHYVCKVKIVTSYGPIYLEI